MARGGHRPGAGRPPAAGKMAAEPGPWEEARGAAPAENKTPLQYMLDVMNSPTADMARRDRMAQAAAPYCHPRADAVSGGKKAQADEAAKTAGENSAWGDDLAPRTSPLN